MIKRLKYYKFLMRLGFFRIVNENKLMKYKNFICLSNKRVFLKNINVVTYGLFYIIPLIYTLDFNRNYFLFIDIEKTNYFYLNRLYKLLKYTLSYLVYDWTYGLISNFYIIELEEYIYNTIKLPSLVFLLGLLEHRKVIYNELNRKNLLCIGLVDLDRSSFFLDYPIFIKGLSEYSYIFSQFIFKLLNVKTKNKAKV